MEIEDNNLMLDQQNLNEIQQNLPIRTNDTNINSMLTTSNFKEPFHEMLTDVVVHHNNNNNNNNTTFQENDTKDTKKVEDYHLQNIENELLLENKKDLKMISNYNKHKSDKIARVIFEQLGENKANNISTNHLASSHDDDDNNNNESIITDHTSLEEEEPSHHARRPMNAFLIFCKRHRAVVREKYPSLENRAVTKILGEWWAGLDENDKSSYTALAKQYKDAFFNANPNFKWYKLPAPPLRTLNTRPNGGGGGSNTNSRPNSALGFNTTINNNDNDDDDEDNEKLTSSDFTPGKLADETQLGNLSALIDPNYNMDQRTPIQQQQIDPIQQVQPPKPLKKRLINNLTEKAHVARNIFNTTPSSSPVTDDNDTTPFVNWRNHALLTSTQTIQERKLKRMHKTKQRHLLNKSEENMTQQELINRIVDHSMCNDAIINQKQRKTAVRTCKGKRYAEFMVEGRLVVNKRNKKQQQQQQQHQELTSTPYAVNLNTTIQKLSDRTKIDTESRQYRKRTNSEASSDDSITKKMFRAADFNLNAKIDALPSLSLEQFQQKKRDSKKRKKISKPSSSSGGGGGGNSNNRPVLETNNNSLTVVGSRKRKARKESITHIEPVFDDDDDSGTVKPDLTDLATLAEVAIKFAKS